jgi:hypothetical protein
MLFKEASTVASPSGSAMSYHRRYGSSATNARSHRRAGSVMDAEESGARLVKELQQVVCGQFDVLVPPLRSAVDAGDQAGAMNTAEVSVDDGVAGLGLVGRTLGQAQMPLA